MKKKALFGVSAAMALATAAYAQPTLDEDLGVLSAGALTRSGSIVGGQVVWYRFELASDVRLSDLAFLNVDTLGSGFDTEVAVYSSTGNLVATDDDDANSLLSALSFGSGDATFPGTVTVTVSNGRDGNLAAGIYYLAVVGYNTAFGTTGWAITTNGTENGSFTVNLMLGTATAVSDPAGTVDLGTVSMPASIVQNTTLNPASVQWYKVTIPDVSAGIPNYLDMDTEGTALAPTNATRLSIYNAAGAYMNLTDTVDGSGSLSQFSFGQTVPARPAVGGVAYNGRDGALRAGTYYIGVAGPGTAPSQTSLTTGLISGHTSTSANTGPMTFSMRLDSATVPPTGVGSATPAVISLNGTSLLRVTVTPGGAPPSTGLAVVTDLSQVGGSSTQTFYDDGTNGDVAAGDNIFSYQYTSSGSEFPASYQLPFAISDLEGRNGAGNIALQILPPPPANDSCATPEVISGYSQFPWDITAATTDGPVECRTGFNDVWFCWTAAESAPVIVETCGLTSMDSVLMAYDGCGCPGAGALACNDDSCSLQSKISFNAVSGNSYMIRVTGYVATTRGSGSINIRSALIGPFNNPANGSTYYMFEATTGWNAAQAMAQSLGGNLVTINDPEENEYVRGSILGYDGLDRRSWIGLTDAQGPGEWVWISGESFVFSNWSAGEPNNPATEHWVELLGGSGQWNNQTENATVVRWGVVEINGGPSCDPDVNCDGVPDQDDVACIILAVAGDMSCFCQADPDFNGDGVPDQGDVADVILTVAGAPCP